AWHHDYGRFINLAYGSNDVSVLYESLGQSLNPDSSGLLVFDVHDLHLIDETQTFMSKPGRFMTFVESDRKFELSAIEALAGRDRYSICITGLKDVPVRIAYTIDDQPLKTFSALLDDKGTVTYFVSSNTAKGAYRFWG